MFIIMHLFICLEYFITFWNYKILQIILYISCPIFRISCFFQEMLVPFLEKIYQKLTFRHQHHDRDLEKQTLTFGKTLEHSLENSTQQLQQLFLSLQVETKFRLAHKNLINLFMTVIIDFIYMVCQYVFPFIDCLLFPLLIVD